MVSREVELALIAASQEALERRHEFLTLEHILFAIEYNIVNKQGTRNFVSLYAFFQDDCRFSSIYSFPVLDRGYKKSLRCAGQDEGRSD